MRVTILISFLFIGYIAFCQKTQLIHQSGFKHNYVLGPLCYIEDLRDNTRLNYIATLQVSGSQDHYLTVANWFDLIKIKAKENGANSYFVSSYSENTASVDLTIRFFFAGERFLKTNSIKKDSNAVIVFNQSHFKEDTGIFYWDKIKVTFDAEKFYKTSVIKNKVAYISTNASDITSVKILFKKNKPSRFFVMPANKKTFTVGDAHAPGNPELSFRTGFAINGMPVTFRRNAPYELSYELGRLILASFH